MKNWIHVFLNIFLLGCSGQNPNVEQINENPAVATCMPADSITKQGTPIKYIELDAYSFDIGIGNDSNNVLLGYGFDCEAPKNSIPQFEWENEDFICLRRQCGLGCWEDIIVDLKLRSTCRYDQVVTYLNNHEYICYEVDDPRGNLLVQPICDTSKNKYTYVQFNIPDDCESILYCLDSIRHGDGFAVLYSPSDSVIIKAN